MHDRIARQRAIIVTQEIRQIIEKHFARERIVRDLVAEEERDILRLRDLLAEVERDQLWRYVTDDQGRPVTSMQEYGMMLGLRRLRRVLQPSRPYEWMLSNLRELEGLVDRTDLEHMGVSKAIAVARLVHRLPEAATHIREWVELAKRDDVSYEALNHQVSVAIQKQNPSFEVPYHVERIAVEASKWAMISEVYELFARTSPTATFGRFIELASAVFRNELLATEYGEVSLDSFIDCIERWMDHAADQIVEQNAQEARNRLVTVALKIVTRLSTEDAN